MKRIWYHLVWVAVVLTACSSERQQDFRTIDERTDMSADEKAVAKAELIEVGPRAPIALSGSDWMAIPLGYELPSKKSRVGGSFYPDSPTGQGLYNVLFYNPTSGEKHLLVDTCCLSIESFMPDSNLLLHLVATHIFYLVEKPDSRHNLPLTALYASDRSGQRLVQVSPPGFHVASWHPVHGHPKVLLVLRQDTNGDSLLTRADAPTIAVADLSQTFPNLETLLERSALEKDRNALLPHQP